MRIGKTEVERSPRNPDLIRLNATIRLDRGGQELHYWFDMPPEMRDSISPSGNGWLILMLPIACLLGEDIVIDRPVNRELLDNLNGIQMLWNSWYPTLHRVRIHAEGDIVNKSNDTCENKTISCFSGGIDSFFSFFHHDMSVTGAPETEIHDLLNVGGFNVTLDDFDAMRQSLSPVAEEFGCRFVPVLTNVRYSKQAIDTAYSIPHWMAHLAQACLLTSIIHNLGLRYSRLIIPSGHDFNDLVHWGTHPLSDPLLSASDLTVVHDGCAFSRVDKTECVAKHPAALNALHVCWQDRRTGNCSKCEKCLRTMATLDLFDVKDQSPIFDWSGYSIDVLSHVWLVDDNALFQFIQLAVRAREIGRLDIAEAAETSMRHSKRKQVALGLVNSNPVSRTAWQVVRPVRNAIRSYLSVRPERS